MSSSGGGGNAITTTISLPPATGVAATDTAAVTAALAQAALKGGIVKGQPALPPPGYVVNAILVIQSGVLLEDFAATPAAGFAGPVLDFQKGGSALFNGIYEFTTAGWMNGGRRIRIFGNTIPNPALINAGAIADNRQTCDGIWIRDADHTTLDDVSVNWLAGYAYKFGDAGGQPIREAHLTNLRAFRCGKRTGGPGGSGPAGKPVVWFENAANPTDQNNTLHFDDLRIVYPHWVALYADQTGDTAALGTRLLHFVGGQIEAGGYGGAQDTMQTGGVPFPFDLCYLGNVKDAYFAELELATSGQKILNLVGSGVHPVQSVIVTKCDLIDSGGTGPGIYADQISSLIVDHCAGFTAGGKIITVTANAQRVIYGDTNDVIDSVANAPVNFSNFDATANPTVFQGPTDTPARAVGAATQPAFAANFGNAGAGWAPLKFWKDASGTVHTLGYVITTGAIIQGAAIYTLPAGYRPTSGQMLSDSAQSYVDTAGVVRSNVGAQAAGFSFWVAHHYPAGG